MKRNIAIILAGGVGSRLGMSTPKQFFKVAGKMVVEHTIDVFERNQHIDEIAIVSNPALVADFENIVLRNKWRKVKKILKGGAERYYSSLSAITAYQNEGSHNDPSAQYTIQLLNTTGNPCILGKLNLRKLRRLSALLVRHRLSGRCAHHRLLNKASPGTTARTLSQPFCRFISTLLTEVHCCFSFCHISPFQSYGGEAG
jgi:hypothetical protein